jgi:hypothetical protein
VENNYQNPTSDAIPPEILQAIGEFPPQLMSKIQVRPGPTFIEYKLKKKLNSSSCGNACFWIFAIVFIGESWGLYLLIIGLVLSVLISLMMARKTESPFLGIDLANQMVYSGNREFKFVDIVELQPIRKAPAPGQRIMSMVMYGLILRNRENLLSSNLFQSLSRSPQIWQLFGPYLAQILSRFIGYTIPCNGFFTEETTTENINNIF